MTRTRLRGFYKYAVSLVVVVGLTVGCSRSESEPEATIAVQPGTSLTVAELAGTYRSTRAANVLIFNQDSTWSWKMVTGTTWFGKFTLEGSKINMEIQREEPNPDNAITSGHWWATTINPTTVAVDDETYLKQ